MKANTNKGNKIRERYVDIAKGISILCITLLHYEDGLLNNHWNIFIGLFMIPMFYITTGWIGAISNINISFKELARKRCKQIGLPYIYWSLIILLFDLILFIIQYYDAYFIYREVYKTITLRGIGTLWFLPALFFGELIWNWLKVKKWFYIIVALFCTLIYQYFYAEFFSGKDGEIYKILDAPFRTISSALNAWIYICIGYYVCQAFKISQLTKLSLGCIGVILTIGGFYFIPYVKIPYVISIIECIGLLLIFYSCQYWKIWNYLNYWGRNSLSLMVTHYSITLVICHIVIENLFNSIFVGWITIAAFCISMLIQYLITTILNKKYPFLLGKI